MYYCLIQQEELKRTQTRSLLFRLRNIEMYSKSVVFDRLCSISIIIVIVYYKYHGQTMIFCETKFVVMVLSYQKRKQWLACYVFAKGNEDDLPKMPLRRWRDVDNTPVLLSKNDGKLIQKHRNCHQNAPEVLKFQYKKRFPHSWFFLYNVTPDKTLWCCVCLYYTLHLF